MNVSELKVLKPFISIHAVPACQVFDQFSVSFLVHTQNKFISKKFIANLFFSLHNLFFLTCSYLRCVHYGQIHWCYLLQLLVDQHWVFQWYNQSCVILNQLVMILISLQRMQICHFLLFEGEVLSVCSLEQCVLISGKFKPVNTCSDGFEQSNCIKFGLYFYKSHHFLDFSCRAPVHCPHSK